MGEVPLDFGPFGYPQHAGQWTRGTDLGMLGQGQQICPADPQRVLLAIVSTVGGIAIPFFPSFSLGARSLGWSTSSPTPAVFNLRDHGPLVQAQWVCAQTTINTFVTYEVLDWFLHGVPPAANGQEKYRVTAPVPRPLAERMAAIYAADFMAQLRGR